MVWAPGHFGTRAAQTHHHGFDIFPFVVYGQPCFQPSRWQCECLVAGDPGEDLRLLAVLPPHVVTSALERAQLDDCSYLTAVQASHVGLACSLSKRIQHTRGGGDWDAWTGSTPFGGLTAITVEQRGTKESASTASSQKKIEDGPNFGSESEESRALMIQKYIPVVGEWPMGGEEPTWNSMP